MSAENVIILISNLNYSYKTLSRKQEERKSFQLQKIAGEGHGRDQDMRIFHTGDKTDNAR